MTDYKKGILKLEDGTYLIPFTPTYTQSETNALLANKQNKLTPGSGITISDTGVISASGAGSSTIPFEMTYLDGTSQTIQVCIS